MVQREHFTESTLATHTDANTDANADANTVQSHVASVLINTDRMGGIEGITARAVALRDKQQQPILLRLERVIEREDPWGLLTVINPFSDRFFAWHNSRTAVSLAAFGVIHSTLLEGDKRSTINSFQQGINLRKYLQDNMLLEQLDEVEPASKHAPQHSPMLVGGVSFSGVPEESGVFKGWPEGDIYLPQVIIWQAGKGAKARVASHHWVSLNTTEQILHAQIKVREEQVQGWLTQCKSPFTSPVSRSSDLWVDTASGVSSESKASWHHRVNKATEAINNGEFSKVVLARLVCFSAQKKTLYSPIQTLLRLRQDHPGAICFALGRGEAGCFVGAAPEELLRVSGHTLYTQAVAGTVARGINEEQDERLSTKLLQNAKNLKEHNDVVQGLKQHVQPFCKTLHIPAGPRVLRLAQVQHLETSLHGELYDPGDILNIAAALHPTPAVGGAPRETALKWLKKHENLDRGWYAAPIGWVSVAGDGTFAVALRSALLRTHSAYAFVGAGIVADSDPDAEWHETELKLNTVVGALVSSEGGS